jgi:hypothetical protein
VASIRLWSFSLAVRSFGGGLQFFSLLPSRSWQKKEEKKFTMPSNYVVITTSLQRAGIDFRGQQ